MLPRLLQGNKLNNVFVARSNGISRKANWSGLEGSCRNMGAVWLLRRTRLHSSPERFACLQGDGQALSRRRAGAQAGAGLELGLELKLGLCWNQCCAGAVLESRLRLLRWRRALARACRAARWQS